MSDAMYWATRAEAAESELAPLRDRVAELEAEVRGWHVFCKEVSPRLLNAEAALARVEALADSWDPPVTTALLQQGFQWDKDVSDMADELRAALASSAPAVSDGEGATSEADPMRCYDCGTPEADCPGIEVTCCKTCAHTPASPVVAPPATDEGGA